MLSHEDVQAALSARLDGESHALDDAAVDAHLSNCARCTAYFERAVALSHRLAAVESVRTGMAPPADLSEVILTGVEPQWRRRAVAQQNSLIGARISLLVLAAVFVVWAVTIVASAAGLAALSADGQVLAHGADPERARLLSEAAAVRFGLAGGLVMTAWRPQLAAGIFPVVATMAAFLLGFAMRDIVFSQMQLAQLYTLIGTIAAVGAVGWAWAAERGIGLEALGRWWRRLGSEPV